jgi:hypothetical protein
MRALLGSDAEQGAKRLRDSLAAPGLPAAVAAYFDPAQGFAGMTFTCLGDNLRDQVTAWCLRPSVSRRGTPARLSVR